MMRRLLWVLAGLAWGGVSFGIGLYATFPTEVARERIQYEFTEATGDYAIEMTDLSLWRLSGVDMENVEVYSLKKGRRTKDNPKPARERTLVMTLDELGVRAAFLPLLTGKRAVAFDAGIYDGHITGTYAQGTAGVDLDFEASGIDLSKLPMASETTKLVLLGKLEGEAELSLNTEEIKESTGSIRFALPGFGLGAGSSVAGFTLPEVMFDKAEVAFEIKDGKAEVTEGTFESSVLTATLTGDITLNKRLARSRNRLELVFTLPEDLDQLAQISPDMKRARDGDGKYHYLITGTVAAPSGRASKTGSRVTGAKDKGLAGGGGLDLPGIGEGVGISPDEADEERKERRRKRIEERRERLRKRREERASEEGGNAGNEEKGADEPPFLDEGPMDDGPPGFDDGPMDLPPGNDDMPPGLQEDE